MKTSNIQIGLRKDENYLEFSSAVCKWTNIITDSSGNIFLIDTDYNGYYLFKYQSVSGGSYSKVTDDSGEQIKYGPKQTMIYKRILNNIICYVIMKIKPVVHHIIYILSPIDSGEIKYTNNYIEITISF